MASPHVAGAAALVAASDGTLTNAEIRQRLVDTAIDLGPAGRDTYYGYGLIDVVAAVADPGPVDTPPWVTMTSPPAGDVSGSSVPVTADAGDDNGVEQVEFFVDGVGIGTDTVGDGNGGWSASWDTMAACNGDHTVSATATDTGNQTGTDSVGVNVANDPDACAVPDPVPDTVSVGSITPSGMNAADPPVPVTVTGSGFAAGATLTFEGGKGSAPTAANVVVSPDGTSLTASVSAKTKGKSGTNSFDVVVTNPDLSTATSPYPFALTR